MESFHYAYVKKYGLSQPYNDLQVLYLIILSLVEVIFNILIVQLLINREEYFYSGKQITLVRAN